MTPSGTGWSRPCRPGPEFARLPAVVDRAERPGARSCPLEEQGRIARRYVVVPLTRALGDREGSVRAAAAAALGALGRAGPDVVDALLRALGDQNQFVRRAAAV